MKYRPIRIYPKFSENPFVEKAIEEINVVRKMQSVKSKKGREVQMIVNNEGQITGTTSFLQYIEVDEEQFAKVYLSQFGKFWDLGKPAIRVFGYILNIIKPNKDHFVFKMEECMQHTKYNGRNLVLTGLSNLIECGIIARTEYDFEFFINPLVVFNGNRVVFANAYIKKKKEIDKNQLEIPFENKEIKG